MDAPENRALTVGLLKRLGMYPLDPHHRDTPRCMCRRCFNDEPDVLPGAALARLRHLAAKRQSQRKFPWEEQNAA